MIKKSLTLMLVLTMFFSLSAKAEFYKYQNLNETPASIYYEPYMDTSCTTSYTPWLRQYHMTTDWELEQGIMGGEGSQQVRAIEISPINPDVAYFATDTSGVWKTTNGGKNWYNTNNNYQGAHVRGLLCDRFDVNTVYVQCQKTGVARSTDGGRTWYEIIPGNDNRANRVSSSLAMDNAGNLYAAFNAGIYKLDRATQTVTNFTPEFASNTGDKGPLFMHIAVSGDGQHIYVGAIINSKDTSVSAGVYTSHDGGKTWKISGTDETKAFSVMSLAIHPEKPLEVYAAGKFVNLADSKAETFSLFISQDGGETWKSASQQYYENLPEGVSKRNVEFYGLEFGPKNAQGVYDLYCCKENSTWNMQVSHDYGMTWEPIFTREDNLLLGSPWEYPDGRPETGYLWQAQAVDMTKPGRILFAMSNIFEYDNGVITRKSSGFSGASVTDMAFNKKGEVAFVVTDRKFAWSESGTFSGDEVPTVRMIPYLQREDHMTTRMVTFDPNDDNHVIVFIGSNNKTPTYFGVRESFDRGKNWEPLKEDTILDSKQRPYGNSRVLCYDPDDSNTIYTSYHVSHDNGKTWTPHEMFVLAMSDDCKYWLGMKGSDKEDELYISTDKGATWTLVSKPAIGTYNYKVCMFDDSNPDLLWVLTANSLRTFTLSTKKWENLTKKLGEYTVLELMKQNPKDPNHIVVASKPTTSPSDKCYRITESRDGGKTWAPILGMWGSFYTSLTFHDDRLYIGGHQGTLIYDYQKYWEYVDNRIKIVYNDREVSFEQEPEITNGRTMVPMRALFEMLGATVDYNNETKLITAVKGSKVITLTPGSDKATVNGKEITLDAPPYITKLGRTVVPVRFISESLEVRVGWDGNTKTVYLIN